MSAATFADRWPENVQGRFYVDAQCLDCDLCRETAPNNFARYDDGGYSYVCKQPDTSIEEAAMKEAIDGCPCEAIFADGDEHDWQQVPATSYVTGSSRDPKKQCSHCKAEGMQPWWKFWK
jgi:ferredoxin